MFDDWSGANEQHRKLLDNTERLERTGKTLTEGYRVVLETEQIGAAVLQDLSVQRETIQRSRGRVRLHSLFHYFTLLLLTYVNSCTQRGVEGDLCPSVSWLNTKKKTCLVLL